MSTITADTGRMTRSSARGRPRGGGGGGGGIHKRRGGGPGRIDRDGDLVMGATPSTSSGVSKRTANNNTNTSNYKNPSTRGHGGARGGPSRGAFSAQEKILRHLGGQGADLQNRISALPRRTPNTKILRIEGLASSKAANNPDRGERGALDFLERKATHLGGRLVTIKKSHLDKNLTLTIMVSNEDAEEMLKLNGWVFAGATLDVTESQDGWPKPDSGKPRADSQAATETKAKLQDFLSQRYDPNLKLLNLSALGQDPVLVEMQLFTDKERAEKGFKAFMAICEQIFPTAEERRTGVLSVSLANNAIDDIRQVFDLAVTFPDLKHLDLSGNQLGSSKGLQRWNHRLQQLETLLLNNNPIETGEPSYKEEMLRRFPKLQVLSGNQVRNPEEIAAAQAAKAAARPIPISQFGPDFRDAGKIGENFLMQFVSLFDNDRPSLAAIFYDDKSNFSLSVLTKAPRDVDAPVLPWQPYLKFSRNLVKITHHGPRVQRLVRGRQLIQEMWKALPATKHPDLATEFSKYLVDCHPLPALADPSGQSPQGVDGLIVNIHGEFDEKDAATNRVGKRSFSRVFVLGPGAPGGNPIRVVSDMLSLRAWNPIPVAEATPAPPAVPAPNQSAPTNPQQQQQQQQQQLIAELSRRTNMTPQYSEMCLAQVTWNLEAAFLKFEETKPNLGPEAFMPPA